MTEAIENILKHKIFVACCAKPIFIVGGSRAGTTWLQSILSLHPLLFSAPETKLFQHVLDPNKRLTFTELYPQKKKVIPSKITPKQLEISFKHLDYIGFIKLSKEVRYTLRQLSELEILDPCTMLNIIIYNAEPNQHKSLIQSYWIEKTPRHIFFLEDIFKFFPTAQVICISRNPVDIALSAWETFNYPIIAGLIDAFKSYRALEKYLQEHPERRKQIFQIAYEELKENPSVTIAEIYKFLGLPPLDMDNDKIKKFSKKAFFDIYRNTQMTSWQAQMKDRKPLDSRNDIQVLQVKKYTFLIARLLKMERCTKKQLFLKREIMNTNFLKFCIKHFLEYLIFTTKINTINFLIKVYRNFK